MHATASRGVASQGISTRMSSRKPTCRCSWSATASARRSSRCSCRSCVCDAVRMWHSTRLYSLLYSLTAACCMLLRTAHRLLSSHSSNLWQSAAARVTRTHGAARRWDLHESGGRGRRPRRQGRARHPRGRPAQPCRDRRPRRRHGAAQPPPCNVHEPRPGLCARARHCVLALRASVVSSRRLVGGRRLVPSLSPASSIARK